MQKHADNEILEAPVPVVPSPFHTPEREQLQKQARDFAMQRVLPLANELDPRKSEIPAELLREMGELGYFGITIGSDHGGDGPRRVRVLHGG